MSTINKQVYQLDELNQLIVENHAEAITWGERLGGFGSSSNLIEALELKKQLLYSYEELGDGLENFVSLFDLVAEAIGIWRSALRRHNNQSLAFNLYCEDCGEVREEDELCESETYKNRLKQYNSLKTQLIQQAHSNNSILETLIHLAIESDGFNYSLVNPIFRNQLDKEDSNV